VAGRAVSTPEERALERARKRANNRAAFFRKRMTGATVTVLLSEACAYARAVGGDLAESAVREMAQEITELADRYGAI
jgi:hypothetical protein